MDSSTIHAIVLKDLDGGMRMKCFQEKEEAKEEGHSVTGALKKGNHAGIKVYLSELDYDPIENKIISEKLINKNSELLFEN